jgi:hypothetical protein
MRAALPMVIAEPRPLHCPDPGQKAAIARAAVEEAWSHVGPTAAIEVLIREALRRCPKPTG